MDDTNTSQYGQIVDLLLKSGGLKEKDVTYALRVQAKLSTPRTLLNVLKDLDVLTDEDVSDAIQRAQLSIRIGELLVELGYLDEDDLLAAFNIQKEQEQDLKLGEILVKYNFVDGSLFYRILSIQLGCPLIQPTLAMVDRAMIARVPLKVIEKYRFLPIQTAGTDDLVVFADPTDQEAVGTARKLFGQNLQLGISDRKSLENIIRLLASRGEKTFEVDDKTAVGIVNAIIVAALQADASDVHIEPLFDRLQVRFRLDGVLFHFRDYPQEIIPVLSSRLKIMCHADIAERRRHQGGRILFDYHDGKVDIRVSFYVTVHGEKIVLRLLRQKAELLDINSLGMSPRMLHRFLEDAVYPPSGVLLVTGPTGSGKTSTIYSCINHLNSPQVSIITAEEPVEYVIEGVSQCSIDPTIDLTFEETLRHIVRQDPDIIMIGEVRDRFSADMAMQAALTGHKVLTTFHTEDSVGGLVRLLNMEVAPFLVSSTVVSVLAQRLLRKVCKECAVPVTVSALQLQRLGYAGSDMVGGRFVKGRGCSACRQTGYKGRLGVFELLVLDEPVRDAILAQRTSYEIRAISIEHSGLVTLLEDGLVKAAAGITTIEEVLRCLPKLINPRPLAEIRRLSGIQS